MYNYVVQWDTREITQQQIERIKASLSSEMFAILTYISLSFWYLFYVFICQFWQGNDLHRQGRFNDALEKYLLVS